MAATVRPGLLVLDHYKQDDALLLTVFCSSMVTCMVFYLLGLASPHRRPLIGCVNDLVFHRRHWIRQRQLAGFGVILCDCAK